MNVRSVNANFSVTGQITASDIQDIAKAGFKSVICNRPDGEAFGQPTYEEIEAAARQVGLQARYVPIVPGQTTEGDVIAFREALTQLPAPILAYCRTGARSSMMWEMSQHVPKGAETKS
jgi:sulfide:quinone oxidoreductase